MHECENYRSCIHIYIYIYVHYIYRIHCITLVYISNSVLDIQKHIYRIVYSREIANAMNMKVERIYIYIAKRAVKSRVERIARIKFWSNFILDTSHTRFPSTARTMELRNTVQGWTEVSNMPRAPLPCATVIRYSLLYRTQWAHK